MTNVEQTNSCWQRKDKWHRVFGGEYAIKDIRVSSRWVAQFGHYMWDVIDANGNVVESWAYLRHSKQKAISLAGGAA